MRPWIRGECGAWVAGLPFMLEYSSYVAMCQFLEVLSGNFV